MRAFGLTQLSNEALLHSGDGIVAQDRGTTAALVAHIEEIDRRRLFAAAGYPSMLAFCVERWHLSDDAAFKRIRAARAAREFPVLLAALDDGRLHLTAVCRLSGHLTAENADALVAAATQRARRKSTESRSTVGGMPHMIGGRLTERDAVGLGQRLESVSLSRQLVSKPVEPRSK
jgi:hypothetical protein